MLDGFFEMIEENGSCKSFKAHCNFRNENIITVSKTLLVLFHAHILAPSPSPVSMSSALPYLGVVRGTVDTCGLST